MAEAVFALFTMFAGSAIKHKQQKSIAKKEARREAAERKAEEDRRIQAEKAAAARLAQEEQKKISEVKARAEQQFQIEWDKIEAHIKSQDLKLKQETETVDRYKAELRVEKDKGKKTFLELEENSRKTQEKIERALVESTFGSKVTLPVLLEKTKEVDREFLEMYLPHAAAVSNQVQHLEFLIQKGFNLARRNPYGKLPIELAVEAGHLEVALFLEKNSNNKDSATSAKKDPPASQNKPYARHQALPIDVIWEKHKQPRILILEMVGIAHSLFHKIPLSKLCYEITHSETVWRWNEHRDTAEFQVFRKAINTLYPITIQAIFNKRPELDMIREACQTVKDLSEAQALAIIRALAIVYKSIFRYENFILAKLLDQEAPTGIIKKLFDEDSFVDPTQGPVPEKGSVFILDADNKPVSAFVYQMPGAGECGFHCLGIPREEVAKMFLANSHKADIRVLVHKEILENFEDLPYSMSLDPLAKPLYTNKDRYQKLKAELDKLKSDLIKKFALRAMSNENLLQALRGADQIAFRNKLKETEEAELNLEICCASQPIFEAYVRHYISQPGHVLTFLEVGALGGSTLDAIVELFCLNVKIWQKSAVKPEVPLTLIYHGKSFPNGRNVNIRFSGDAHSGHYDLLLPQPNLKIYPVPTAFVAPKASPSSQSFDLQFPGFNREGYSRSEDSIEEQNLRLALEQGDSAQVHNLIFRGCDLESALQLCNKNNFKKGIYEKTFESYKSLKAAIAKHPCGELYYHQLFELFEQNLENIFDQNWGKIVERLVEQKYTFEEIEIGLLCAAARQGDLPLVRLLIAAGADVNRRDIRLQAIDYAIKSRNQELVKFINEESERAFSAVYKALTTDTDNIIKLLTDLRISANHCNKHGSTALYSAMNSKNYAKMRVLLSAGASPYQKNGVVDLPLFQEVASRGDLEAIKLFIEWGILQSLEERGSSIDQPGGILERTALHQACVEGRIEVIHYLLNLGADANSVDRFGYSPLHLAIQNGSLEVVTMLVERGANPNPPQTEGAGILPLTLALNQNKTDIVHYLLSCGASFKGAILEVNGERADLLKRIAEKVIALQNQKLENANQEILEKGRQHLKIYEKYSAMAKQLLEHPNLKAKINAIVAGYKYLADTEPCLVFAPARFLMGAQMASLFEVGKLEDKLGLQAIETFIKDFAAYQTLKEIGYKDLETLILQFPALQEPKELVNIEEADLERLTCLKLTAQLLQKHKKISEGLFDEEKVLDELYRSEENAGLYQDGVKVALAQQFSEILQYSDEELWEQFSEIDALARNLSEPQRTKAGRIALSIDRSELLSVNPNFVNSMLSFYNNAKKCALIQKKDDINDYLIQSFSDLNELAKEIELEFQKKKDAFQQEYEKQEKRLLEHAAELDCFKKELKKYSEETQLQKSLNRKSLSRQLQEIELNYKNVQQQRQNALNNFENQMRQVQQDRERMIEKITSGLSFGIGISIGVGGSGFSASPTFSMDGHHFAFPGSPAGPKFSAQPAFDGVRQFSASGVPLRPKGMDDVDKAIGKGLGRPNADDIAVKRVVDKIHGEWSPRLSRVRQQFADLTRLSTAFPGNFAWGPRDYQPTWGMKSTHKPDETGLFGKAGHSIGKWSLEQIAEAGKYLKKLSDEYPKQVELLGAFLKVSEVSLDYFVEKAAKKLGHDPESIKTTQAMIKLGTKQGLDELSKFCDRQGMTKEDKAAVITVAGLATAAFKVGRVTSQFMQGQGLHFQFPVKWNHDLLFPKKYEYANSCLPPIFKFRSSIVKKPVMGGPKTSPTPGRTYKPEDQGFKHHPNGYGSTNPVRDAKIAQELLDSGYSIPHMKAVFNVYEDKLIKFHYNNMDGWHCFEVQPRSGVPFTKQVPPEIIRKMQYDNLISKSKANKWIRNKE